MIWITGLSAVGKTSIAGEVVRLLCERGQTSLLLDGDAVRNAFGDSGYDRASRLAAAYRISRLAQLIARQNVVAVVATLSLFHEIHAFNRSAGIEYLEVVVECDESRLCERSSLYASGNDSLIVGRGIAAEFPRTPHLVLRNDGARARIPRLAEHVVDAWIAHVSVR